ncbi:MAG: hypothetical protein HY682_01475 [Chloroflexi bacterium]|nr:hypothetical protein [Chloroflexota bacterium]
MITAERSNRWFVRVLFAIGLLGLMAAAVTACGPEDELSGAADRESEPAEGYVFVDVGAWDDTHSVLPVFATVPDIGALDVGGYRFLDVGAWDDTNIEWPAQSATLETSLGSSWYRFLDVGAWDDANINWP